MSTPLLNVEDLSVARGGLTLLSGMNFEIGPGDALIVRGPNGIGKTSLLRTLVGLQSPTAGRIQVTDEGTAFATHNDGQKATLTVNENLHFWAGLYGNRSIENAVSTFGMKAFCNRLVGQLSAGQRRRLSLARMLVTGRPLWVFDEPTISLDEATISRFEDAVRGHLSQGGAAVIATHTEFKLSEKTLDLLPFRATADVAGAFDEAFL